MQAQPEQRQNRVCEESCVRQNWLSNLYPWIQSYVRG